MQFLAPWMLAGAAAVAIPLVLHFFYRARYKPLPWAPMKFLKEAIEQTSRRLRFQEWILLALRCLAILLLALALARPGWKTAVTAGRGEAIDAVFVFDTSFSMAAPDGDKTRLQRAQAAALAVLDTLPPGSSVQIYGCADRATLLGPQERFNLDQARKLISEIELTSLSTDLLPGLAEAYAAATRGTAPAKEIYVFTDLQKMGFERQPGALKAKCEEIRQIANLVFVRCGSPERRIPNIAVTDVKWISEIPHTGTSVPFVVTLRNTGATPVKGIKVKLAIIGRTTKTDEAQVDQINATDTHTVTLTGALDEPGLLEVRVTIEDAGGLPGDNLLTRTILVRDKIRVLLVDGTPNPELPTASGAHFVETALNPQRLQKHYIEYDTVSASEASPLHLENKDLVYLLNAPIRDTDPLKGLSPTFLARLNEFVRSGGGLIVAVGDQVNATVYNKTLGSVGSGYKLLPFDLGEVRSTTETAPFFPAADTVDPASYLWEFRRGGLADALQRNAISRMFEVVPETPGGRVLVKTTDGRPYITSKVVGSGEVVLLTSSLDESWQNFSSSPGEFQVPFTLRSLNHLTGRTVYGESALAGQPLVWKEVPPGVKVCELVQPPRAGETIRPRVRIDVPDRPADEPGIATATDTWFAGIYNIVPFGKADTSGPMYAVNPVLLESENMAVAEAADVKGWLGYEPPIILAGADTESAVGQLRTRSEWTEWILLLLLLVLLAETAWAWVCGRAW
jgi:hypothetical protein